jgi:hypothetical protein
LHLAISCLDVLHRDPRTLRMALAIDHIEKFSRTSTWAEAPLGDSSAMPVAQMQQCLYQPQHADLLRLRAFAGKWGGHDGPIDKSPAFGVKTGRYFRKLLRNL